MNTCFKRVVSAFLLLTFLAAGVWMLVIGISGIVEEHTLKEQYETVEGNLSDYSLDSPGGYDSIRRRHKSATYYLTYTYFVDNVPYTVTTDYSTGTVPALGTARTVYFDPADPENAILGGTSSSAVLIVLGAMFTLVPLLFILISCAAMGWLPKTRIDLTGLVAGGILAVMGVSFLLIMEDGVGFHPMMLIPGIMAVVGTLVVIRSFFPQKED